VRLNVTDWVLRPCRSAFSRRPLAVRGDLRPRL